MKQILKVSIWLDIKIKLQKPLALILPKMSTYVKTYKVKDVDKDTNNKLIPFHIDAEKL